MSKPIVMAALACMMLTSGIAASVQAADNPMKTQLKPFNVTIRVFDPTKGSEGGQDYVLPVDSPDAEHAVASTLANAVSFSTKTKAGQPLPVAFTCVRVEPR